MSGSVVACLVAVSIGACAAMAVAWSMQRRTRKAGWADVFWTFGTGAAGVVLALVPLPGHPGPDGRQVLVAALAGLWSLRLGSHIATRTIHGPDDPRYAKLNTAWGADAPRKMFWFLQVQALTIIPLAITIFAAARNPRPSLDLRDFVGACFLVVAIIGEGLADRQLKTFGRAPQNKGRVCDIGLWRWSRHPNYFFEWIGWLAYPVIAVDLSGAYPWGWAALSGPLLIYVLLVHVSGIPPLEEYMLHSRGDAFRVYQKRTSAFFPAPAAPFAGFRRNMR